MKIGPRIPSLRKRIAARTSWQRYVRHNLGLKAPRGYGWITNPKRAAYNRIYNRTTFDVFKVGRSRRKTASSLGAAILTVVVLIVLAALLHA